MAGMSVLERFRIDGKVAIVTGGITFPNLSLGLPDL
jgi:hypothetical protein